MVIAAGFSVGCLVRGVVSILLARGMLQGETFRPSWPSSCLIIHVLSYLLLSSFGRILPRFLSTSSRKHYLPVDESHQLSSCAVIIVTLEIAASI